MSGQALKDSHGRRSNLGDGPLCPESKTKIWIARDYLRCSGCRRCEIACSLHHEGRIWPEASRIRVFMLVPGLEIPHFCAQCDDYPCVESCPSAALSVDDETGAVFIDTEMCTGCGACIDACPGQIPHLHPKDNYVLICDLCGGEPECTKACDEGRWNAIWIAKEKDEISAFCQKLFARTPEDITADLAANLYGKKSEEVI